MLIRTLWIWDEPDISQLFRLKHHFELRFWIWQNVEHTAFEICYTKQDLEKFNSKVHPAEVDGVKCGLIKIVLVCKIGPTVTLSTPSI